MTNRTGADEPERAAIVAQPVDQLTKRHGPVHAATFVAAACDRRAPVAVEAPPAAEPLLATGLPGERYSGGVVAVVGRPSLTMVLRDSACTENSAVASSLLTTIKPVTFPPSWELEAT